MVCRSTQEALDWMTTRPSSQTLVILVDAQTSSAQETTAVNIADWLMHLAKFQPVFASLSPTASQTVADRKKGRPRKIMTCRLASCFDKVTVRCFVCSTSPLQGAGC